MSFLFLDIDGVMNNLQVEVDTESPITAEEQRVVDSILNNHCIISEKRTLLALRDIDPNAVSKLNELIAHHPADVIISSTWRKFLGADNIQILLNFHGFKGHVEGSTPMKMSYVQRGLEIKWFLEGEAEQPFVILDDDPSPSEYFKDNYVQVDPIVGLTQENIEQAKSILGAK